MSIGKEQWQDDKWERENKPIPLLLFHHMSHICCPVTAVHIASCHSVIFRLYVNWVNWLSYQLLLFLFNYGISYNDFIETVMDIRMIMEHWLNVIDSTCPNCFGGGRDFSALLYPPKVPYGMAWDWARFLSVICRRYLRDTGKSQVGCLCPYYINK
jgi:hypothetical protein